MTVAKSLNLFFFGEERISLSDFLWFYGSIGFIAFILIFVIIPTQIELFL